MKKMLVVYYSLSNGNTKWIAEKLAKAAGADIVSVETVEAYTGTYEELVAQGEDEVNRGYRPPIKALDVNIADYDVIAVGTPTWWYTMAPAVLTFLSGQDFTGKTVIPFMTNGGWPGHVIKDMKKACQGAVFAYEMEIKFDSTGGAKLITKESEIDEWIAKVISSNM